MLLFSYEHLRIQVKILEDKLESLGGKVYKSLWYIFIALFLTYNNYKNATYTAFYVLL